MQDCLSVHSILILSKCTKKKIYFILKPVSTSSKYRLRKYDSII